MSYFNIFKNMLFNIVKKAISLKFLQISKYKVSKLDIRWIDLKIDFYRCKTIH